MTTKESNSSIFSDRRVRHDRRKQDLPMPSGLDRRRGSRRQRHFQAQPWWLRTNYAAELVSESTVIESGFFEKVRRGNKKPPGGAKR